MSLLGTPVAHTSIVARTEVMKSHPYGARPEAVHTEDYELFSRMIEAGVGIANLDETLITVKLDPRGVSLRHERVQVENFVRCARRHLWGMTRWEPDQGALRVFVNRMTPKTTPQDLQAGLRLLDLAEREFVEREPGARREIQSMSDMQRIDILVQALLKGSSALRAAAAACALRYGRRLTSAAARSYATSKLVRS
jgi:hypothetical protein